MNFKKYLSFFKFDSRIEKVKTKKYFFWIHIDLKPISKNKNQNFWIHYLTWNQKMDFKKFFYFSISLMKLKNEKWKKFKIRFVFKSKNELYFRYTDYQSFWVHFLFWNQKMNFKKFFCFSILVMKWENEKWQKFQNSFCF